MRSGSASESDGYVVTFTTDMNTDTSACQIFAADDVAAGPVAQVKPTDDQRDRRVIVRAVIIRRRSDTDTNKILLGLRRDGQKAACGQKGQGGDKAHICFLLLDLVLLRAPWPTGGPSARES